MKNIEMIKLVSKIGIIVLMTGLGVSFAGVIGYFIEHDSANKATMIGGLVLGAIGYLLIAAQNVIAEDF